ncbi:type II CAAX endopeptidase family protein [Clostridium aestuarii]|uniref:Type II CAAX endopeptidase family protein n=1 Tax=Clostridium aestuarii TaxID=338193 RepID=A0ABT4CVN2_9CLOT|nr:type II CAAX endopeptidase family protein [Clostridium aestuarii]MCY6483045.1 type II CAAX endopeptidase family protein [Clostridium aestuarii]
MFSNERGLFKEAKKAKFLPNIIVAYILAIAFLIGGEILGIVTSKVFKVSLYGSNSIRMMFDLIFSFGFVALVIFTWVKFIEKRNISSVGFSKINFIKKYFMGFISGVVMFSSVVMILGITGHIVIDKTPTAPVGMAALSSVLIILPGWIIQSGTEEILSRGWLMNVLGARYNVKLGLFSSALLFGLLHMFNDNVSVIAIINIIIVGIFLGLYVIKTEDLWGACGLHCAWNWIQGNIFGFEVSGEKISTGSIMKLKLVGDEWFTGGAFGPEAGIAATIVLLAGITVILFRQPKKIIY